MTITHQPQPPSIHAHRLAGLVPAVLATLRTPALMVGFGTAAGYMRVCQCGYATRDPNRFANHLEHKIGETIMSNPLAFLDDPTPTIRHRLVDTAKHGRIYVCSCGYDTDSLQDLRQHLNGGNDDDRAMREQ